jgi:hypothetical protein
MTTGNFAPIPELVKSLRSILETDVMKLWLEAMEEQSPVNFVPTHDVTPHFAHIQLGQQTGWAQYLQNFQVLAANNPKARQPNQTKVIFLQKKKTPDYARNYRSAATNRRVKP